MAFRLFARARHFRRYHAAALAPGLGATAALSSAQSAAQSAAQSSTQSSNQWSALPSAMSGVAPVTWLVVALAALALYTACITVRAARHKQQAEALNLRLQNRLMEAQLIGLSNQLNPHFLANSLDQIRAMIHTDARQADTMVGAFSDILRYWSDSSRRERVSLGQELAIIDKYLALVRPQFDQRMRFSLHIAPALHSAMVPPMVLHALVENAIKHGLEHLRSGGRLEVEAMMDQGALTIEVRNDVAAGPVRSAGGSGVGLRNIEQRLKLLYGPHASLHARRDGNEFAATLVLPPEHAA